MAMLAGVNLSQAATLALYEAGPANGNVVNTFNNPEFDSSDTEPLTTAGRLVNGGGISAGNAGLVITNAFFNPSDSGSAGFNFASVTTANRAAAITAGDFFSLTVATNGNAVRFEEFSFFQNQFGTTGMYDLSYTVGGVENFLLTGQTPVASNGSVVKTTSDFPDFTTTNDVTFTYYLYGAAATGHGTRFDDITVIGTIVPEPSRAALLGLAGIAVLMRRKR